MFEVTGDLPVRSHEAAATNKVLEVPDDVEMATYKLYVALAVAQKLTCTA